MGVMSPDRPTRRAVLAGGSAAVAGSLLAAACAAGDPDASPGQPGRTPDVKGWYVPGDHVPHERTWMAWPDSRTIWGDQLTGIQAAIGLVARTIAKYEPVYLLANATSTSTARSACGPAVTVIDSIPVDDCWMRDDGPIFRTNGSSGLDAIGLNFNGWGNKQTHANDAHVAKRVAGYLGVGFTAAGLTSEGGAIETDGAGTLMATRSSIINANRNPGMTQSQLSAAMCAAYGATKVIWFQGIKGQDITDDHVDATSRFLAPGAAAVQIPDPSEHDVWATDEDRQDQVLSTATDARGRAIAVTKIHGPDYNKIRQSKDLSFVGSYANYYVCNGAVISAQFGDQKTEAQAKAVLTSLFPGRAVVQLDVDAIGAGGGGIHCVTQQQPAVKA
jgi:agmatine deiminase